MRSSCKQSTDICALYIQGVEESYDAAVSEYFQPYHHFVDKLLRFGFNHDRVADQVIACSKFLCCPAILLSTITTKIREFFFYGGTSGRSCVTLNNEVLKKLNTTVSVKFKSLRAFRKAPC